MAVRIMTSKENAHLPNVETILNYPGHSVEYIHHHWNCPHQHDSAYLKERGPNCQEYCQYNEPLYMKTEYVGCVLSKYERNGYDDSDFYAVVWDGKEIQHIEYASTRSWTYPNGAVIDATPEVIEAANAYLREIAFNTWKKDNEKQSKMPYVGRQVKVIAGIKVPQGVIGEVFWFGDDKYKSMNHRRYGNPMADAMGLNKYNVSNKRIGIKWVENGILHKEFTSATNVEVIDSQKYLEDETIGRELIQRSEMNYRSI